MKFLSTEPVDDISQTFSKLESIKNILKTGKFVDLIEKAKGTKEGRLL